MNNTLAPCGCRLQLVRTSEIVIFQWGVAAVGVGYGVRGEVAVVASPSGNQELRHVAQSAPTATLAISSVPKGVYYLDRGVYARNGETRGVLFTFPQYNLSSRHEVLTHPCQGGDTSCVLDAPQPFLADGSLLGLVMTTTPEHTMTITQRCVRVLVFPSRAARW